MGCDVIVDKDCTFYFEISGGYGGSDQIEIKCKKGDRLYFDYWSDPDGATHDR